jgi:hypothetical protein
MSLQEVAAKLDGPFQVFCWDRAAQGIVPYPFPAGEEKNKLQILWPGRGKPVPALNQDLKFRFSYPGKCSLFRIKILLGRQGRTFTVGRENLRKVSRKLTDFWEWSLAQGTKEGEEESIPLPNLSGKTLRWEVEAVDDVPDPPIILARSRRLSFSIQAKEEKK